MIQSLSPTAVSDSVTRQSMRCQAICTTQGPRHVLRVVSHTDATHASQTPQHVYTDSPGPHGECI